MRSRWMMALTGLSGLFAPALAGQAGTVPTDSASLQGAWSMVSGAADGYPMPAEYVKGMRRVFAGNEVTVTMGGSLFFKAVIVLDPTNAPKRIDYHMTGGPTAGATQLGIYQIAGDTVQFCFGAPNASRPADFKTVPGDGRTLSKWVRTRP